MDHNSDELNTLFRQGSEYLKHGKYALAYAHLQKSIELEPKNSAAWNIYGITLLMLEKYEDAITSFDQAIKLKPDNNIAQNNRSKAQQYQEVIAFDDKLDSEAIYLYVGVEFLKLEKYEKAVTHFDKALQLNLNDDIAWFYLGNILGILEKYQEAVICFDQVLRLKPDNAVALYYQGLALFNLKRYEQAITSYDKALEIKPDFDRVWDSRGTALYHLGRYEEAITSYDKATQLKPDKYQAWYNRGLAAGKSRGYIPFLHTQQLNPELNKRGYEGELASYYTAINRYIHRETHLDGWEYLNYQIGRSHSFYSHHQPNSSILLQKAEEIWKKAFPQLKPKELHLKVLQDLVQCLFELGKVQDVEEMQRQGTDLLNRILADLQRTDLNKNEIKLKFADFNQITVNLAVQSGYLAEALTLAEEGKNICLRWLLGTEEIPEIKYSQIQTLLKPTTAIVYWHLSPAALTTFVLLPDEPVPILIESAIVPEENDQRPASLLQLLDWEDWLTKWNDNYKTYGASKDKQKTGKKKDGNKDYPWRTEMQKRLDSLGQILNIAAIEDTLHNHSIQNLILIPHRDLHRFPLHSLFENYTCTYLPSAYLALQQAPIKSQLLKPLIVENPKSQPHLNGKLQKLDALPFAEVEAALIRQIYAQHTYVEDKNDQTQRITCEAVQAALSQSHDIFHFSGHGTYNSQNPAESCLFLSGTEQLTLLDIKDLDLSSYRLVCLAACETAVTGNQTITDEYVGLVSAFLKAGVTYVVSTLWTVESAATMLMMVKFHQNLQAEQPPPTALKNAQNSLKSATREDLINFIQGAIAQLSEQKVLQLALEDEQFRIRQIEENQPYSHPYYWAAFTISGLDQ
jgi:CHAT domain-containing protein/Flp pilus assembly protein TadD